MVKLWNLLWATIREEIRLIAKDTKTFLAAVMTALVFILLIGLVTSIRWGWAQAQEKSLQKDLRLTDKDIAAQGVLEIGRSTARAQQRESDWRDTAQKYKNLYNELKR